MEKTVESTVWIEGVFLRTAWRPIRYPSVRVVQKFKKLSETPATAPMIAKLCMNDCKNREIAEKLVQLVTPHICINPRPQKWPILKLSQTY